MFMFFVCVFVCCVWDSLKDFWGSECAACAFVVCVCVFVFVCTCCVRESLEHVCWSECAAGGFVVCLCGFVVNVLLVGQFGASFGD